MTTTTTTTHPRPHCQAPRDLSTRMTGDSVLCPDCGGWFTVIWQAGGAVELRAIHTVMSIGFGRRKRGKR